MDLIQAIDSAREITGSDRATATALEVSPAKVCEWRSGVRTPTPEQAARLADLIGEPWWSVVAAAEAAAAERRGDKPKARQWLQRMTAAAAPSVLALAMLMNSGTVQAAQSTGYSGLHTIYIMGRRRVRRLCAEWLRHSKAFALGLRPKPRRALKHAFGSSSGH